MPQALGPDRRRNKKLLAAFHFSKTGGWNDREKRWDCHTCRIRRDYRTRNCKLVWPGKLPPLPAQLPVWAPTYKYKGKDKTGKNVERAFLVRDFALDECPVSYITAKSQTLVKLWQKAGKRNKTLNEMLDTDEGWLEDVEELLQATSDEVKELYEADKLRRISL